MRAFAKSLWTLALQDYRSSERNRVVLYTTGVKVVRDTHDKCLRVKKILQTHMVRYDERDVSMSRDDHRRLADRLGSRTASVDLPQVFADGLHIGVRACAPLTLNSTTRARPDPTGPTRTVSRDPGRRPGSPTKSADFVWSGPVGPV